MDSDGGITITLGIVAGLVLLRALKRGGWAAVILILLGLAIALVGAVDISDVNDRGHANLFGRDVQVVSVGWSLWMVTISGALIAASGFALRWRYAKPGTAKRRRTADAAQADQPPAEPGAPGWYRDPTGEAQWRYWDGHRWTDATA